MIFKCIEFPDREFASKSEMLQSIAANKKAIISLKKSALKTSESCSIGYIEGSQKEETIVKSNTPVLDPNLSELLVKVVMNTTGLLDSHRDVHVKDIWKRTLQHSNEKLHLQEHARQFDKVISNNALAYVKNMSWKSLGYDFEGSTQALIFESLVKSSRNPLMFDQYKNGWVNNHSVGMQYVELFVCINSGERWAQEEKENWDKYIDFVINKEDAENYGYFYAVTEAKLIEGSAVLMGSNYITPTLENNMKLDNSPSELKTDSSLDTQEIKSLIINPNTF